MWNGYRLLVIEDDDALCESIADVLRFTGYEVETAQDTEGALQALRDEPAPDAILLDMLLRTTTAEQLLEEIDARSYPHPPVVLMTGMTPPAWHDSARQRGVAEAVRDRRAARPRRARLRTACLPVAGAWRRGALAAP